MNDGVLEVAHVDIDVGQVLVGGRHLGGHADRLAQSIDGTTDVAALLEPPRLLEQR